MFALAKSYAIFKGCVNYVKSFNGYVYLKTIPHTQLIDGQFLLITLKK